jgi:signal transduction histidine kinase
LPARSQRGVGSESGHESADTAPLEIGAFRSRTVDSLLLAAAVFAFIVVVLPAEAAAGGARYPIVAAWLALPWLPLGASAGTFLFRGTDRWPGAFGGILLAYLWLHIFSLGQSLLQAGVDTLCAVLVAALLRVWYFEPSFSNWRDPLLLWAAAAIGAACESLLSTGELFLCAWYKPDTIDPALASIVLDGNGHPALSMSFLYTVLRWCGNWVTGIALVVPCVYVLSTSGHQRIASQWVEKLVLTLLLSAWTLAALSPLPAFAFLPLAVAALLLVVWSAIRLGPAAVSFMTLCLTLTTSFSVLRGHGPLRLLPEEAVTAVWAFAISLTVIGFAVTILVSNRNAALRRYMTLFDSNPIPLWVQEGRAGHIVMANEAAVQHYGFSRAEFAQLSLANLEAAEVTTALAFDSGERLHRTRDGRLIDVILHYQTIMLDGREATLVFSYDVTERNRLRSALLDATDQAARQFGAELHDGLGQELLGLSLIVRSEMTMARRGVLPDYQSLAKMDAIAQRAVMSCRHIAHRLSALIESGGNLAAALEKLPERFRGEGSPAIHVHIQGESELPLPEVASSHVYRIAQEALANALKHANAKAVEIRLNVTPSSVLLTIRDDGVGLPRTEMGSRGLGLSSMQHRAAAIGARLEVKSLSEGGTEVRLECPVDSRVRKNDRVNPHCNDIGTTNEYRASGRSQQAG